MASDSPDEARTPPRDQPAASDSEDGIPKAPEPPVFPHPQWMLGVVLVFAVAAIIAGLENPIWFVVGFPCILVLVVWLWVRWKTSG